MVASDRGVPVVGEQDALATDLVVGLELRPQRGVLDLAPQVQPPRDADRAEQGLRPPHLAAEGGVEQLGQAEGRAALDAQQPGPAREGAVVALGVGLVRLRDDVRRRALEDRHRRDPVDDAGHELDRTRAGADDRDLLAAQVDVVAPLGGVERRAVERVRTRQGGDDGVRQLTHRGDDQVGVVRRAVGRRDGPGGAVGTQRAGGDRRTGDDQVGQPLALGGLAQVGEDLGLLGVAPAPRRVDRPRPGVERGRHVAGRVGIGVVAPHTTDALGPLEDGDVGDALLLEGAGRAESAEAGSDDDDAGAARAAVWAAHGSNLGPDGGPRECPERGGLIIPDMPSSLRLEPAAEGWDFPRASTGLMVLVGFARSAGLSSGRTLRAPGSAPPTCSIGPSR